MEDKVRPRNISESIKKPETTQNDLALVLEKRRQNLSKPVIPERPKKLPNDTKDKFSLQSRENKVVEQPKVKTVLKTPNKSFEVKTEFKTNQSIGTKPRGKSFLHSYSQSGKLSPSNSSNDCDNYPKEW